jgi:hypothetical protein
MSAFIVADETIRRVVSALMPREQSCEWGDTTGRELMKLNRLAVATRYAHNAEILKSLPTDEDIDAYSYSPTFPSPFVKLVALNCLIYQCSEGKEVEASPYYVMMRQRADSLRAEIVSGLPEYQAATKDGWN